MMTMDTAQPYYAGAESAHDFDHILRVLALAERIARAEGADIEIVRAAVLLHDVARADEDAGNHAATLDHAQLAADRARNILIARGAPREKADAVAHCIAAHRFRGTTPPQTLEAKIVFDADKLDSIGAIGIARAFAVSGALNQRLWSEVAPDAVATRDQHHSNHSAFAEFTVKLSKVKERLHTAPAREIAVERHAFMEKFFARMESEIKGEA